MGDVDFEPVAVEIRDERKVAFHPHRECEANGALIGLSVGPGVRLKRATKGNLNRSLQKPAVSFHSSGVNQSQKTLSLSDIYFQVIFCAQRLTRI